MNSLFNFKDINRVDILKEENIKLLEELIPLLF